MNLRLRHAAMLFGFVAGLAILWLFLRSERPATAQTQGPTARPFSVTARRYRFDPPRIEVNQDDLVTINLRTEDIAHILDAMVRDFGDVQQPVGSRHDLDERAEVGDALNLSEIRLVQLRRRRQFLDDRNRLLR